MFKYTIDSKPSYIDSNGEEIIDLGQTIFNTVDSNTVLYTYYKATKEIEMRPDLISVFACGTDEYAEMIMKYSLIDNPFAIEEGDILAIPTVSSMYNEIKETNVDSVASTDSYDYVKNYHKYIDKNKLPNNSASDNNDISVSSTSSGVEANIANNGNSGIKIENGRIYFGNTVSASSSNIEDVLGNNDTSSNMVDCAKSGVTIGQFINAAIKNSI
jgi:hypothetical protein